MQSEPEQTPNPNQEGGEKELCTSCGTPNDPGVNFCRKCGAPLSVYAATGPFERLFAEGHTYREAVERPRNLMMLLGMWLIFGFLGLFGGLLLVGSMRDGMDLATLFGGFMLVISSVILWKTTRNYFKPAPQIAEE